MPGIDSDPVLRIRAASRALVREWGFLNRTLAGTDLSPSAVHALIEIGNTPDITAKRLSEELGLDKSTVSRLIRSLVASERVEELRSADDGRAKALSLTSEGRRTLEAINIYAEGQVRSAVKPLAGETLETIVTGLEAYAAALRGSRGDGPEDAPPSAVTVRRGYVPRLLARIVDMHADYYSRNVGFGMAFETKVADALAAFLGRADGEVSDIWHAESGGRIVGSVAVDGENLGENTAHLRWFIVDDCVRGLGAGKALIDTALAFCDARGFAKTRLWTLKGLGAAHHLYERHGFTRERSYVGDQWGRCVNEEVFVRPLYGKPVSG